MLMRICRQDAADMPPPRYAIIARLLLPEAADAPLFHLHAAIFRAYAISHC